jgi:hypothetical protein
MRTGAFKRSREIETITNTVGVQPESGADDQNPSPDSLYKSSLMLGCSFHGLFTARKHEGPGPSSHHVSKSSSGALQDLQLPIRRFSNNFSPTFGATSLDSSPDVTHSSPDALVADLEVNLSTRSNDWLPTKEVGINSQALNASGSFFYQPIFSMSMDDSRIMDVGGGPFSCAYVTNLEKFSDSIITLFGSRSNFSA